MSKEKNNLTAKILSLVIAIFLWSIVMKEVDPQIEPYYKNVSVTLLNTGALERQGLVIMEPKDVKVNVRVSGRASDLVGDKFSAKNITASVDLSGWSEGEVRVPVIVDLQGVSNVQIVNSDPKDILFVFEKIVQKDLQVNIESEGEVAEGYVLGDLSTKSQTISIKGPRSWVNEVSKVVATVDVSNRNNPGKIARPVKILDDEGNQVRGVEIQPSMIDIDIPVFRTLSLPIELQTENQLPEDYLIKEINIHPSTIDIVGDNSIEQLTKINTKVIDINSLLDKSTAQVELDLPDNVELLSPNQKVIISYIIEDIGTKDFILNMRDLDIINLNEELIIDEEDMNKEIIVTLKGTKSLLDSINIEDIKILLDLEDLVEGHHEIDLIMEEIEGVTLKEINPEPLTINLIGP